MLYGSFIRTPIQKNGKPFIQLALWTEKLLLSQCYGITEVLGFRRRTPALLANKCCIPHQRPILVQCSPSDVAAEVLLVVLMFFLE
jgi:hypothetical protein